MSEPWTAYDRRQLVWARNRALQAASNIDLLLVRGQGEAVRAVWIARLAREVAVVADNLDRRVIRRRRQPIPAPVQAKQTEGALTSPK